MPFSPAEQQALLALKGVGPTVLARLEQLGYGSFARLREVSATDITAQAASLLGSTCWQNSPQARAAIEAAIARARQGDV